MQLSRPLLILPLFFARRLLFQRRFFDFLFKAPSFSLSGGFFFVLVFFFCSADDVLWGCLFFLSAFFFRFSLCFFFALGGFISTTQEKGERNKWEDIIGWRE